MVTVVTAVCRDVPLDAQVEFWGHLNSPFSVRLVEDTERIIYPDELLSNKSNDETKDRICDGGERHPLDTEPTKLICPSLPRHNLLRQA